MVVRGAIPTTKLPLILAVLLLISLSLLIILSMHNPDPIGKRPRSAHLLRDRVRAGRDKDARAYPPLSATIATTKAMEAVPAASSLRAEPLRVLESVPESVPGYVPEYVPQHADSLIFTRLRRHYVDLVMRDKKQQQLNTYPADEDVVEVLHRALSTGQLISSSSVSSPERDLGETIEKLINLDRPKFIFDVTTSPLAISFAQLASETFPWLLAVMVPVAQKKTGKPGPECDCRLVQSLRGQNANRCICPPSGRCLRLPSGDRGRPRSPRLFPATLGI